MLYVKFLIGLSSQDSGSNTCGEQSTYSNTAHGHSAKIKPDPLAHDYKPVARRYIKLFILKGSEKKSYITGPVIEISSF
jgi:hypothetical protein